MTRRSRTIFVVLLVLAAAGLPWEPAQARIVGGTINHCAVMNPPATVNTGINQVRCFDEQQSVLLAGNLAVDGGGSILAGTVVASHYFVYDPAVSTTAIGATIRFDRNIIGVISTSVLLNNGGSDTVLGVPGVNYTMDPSRGLEPPNDVYLISNDLRQLTVTFTAGGPGDGLRVITQPSAPCLTVIDFDGLVVPTGGVVSVGSPYSEDGYLIDELCPGGASTGLATLSDDATMFTTSRAMHRTGQCDVDGQGSKNAVRLRAASGAQFSVCSMDLAQLNNPTDTPTISFTGVTPFVSGSTSDTVTLPAGTIPPPLPNRVPLPNLTNVGAVYWFSDQFQWDNICICSPVATCIAPPPGLVAWWAGDSCKANDRIHGHHGVYSGSVPCVPGAKVGLHSLPFDAANSVVVTVPDDSELEPGTGSFTVDLWIRPTMADLTGTVPLLVKQASWELLLVNGVPRFDIVGSLASVFAPGPPGTLTANEWHFLAVTVERADESQVCTPGPCLDTVTVHRDNTFQATSAVPGAIDSSLNLLIGGDPFGAMSFFDGLLDEVEIYDRALSLAEVDAIRGADIFGKCKDVDSIRVNIIGLGPSGGLIEVNWGALSVQVATFPGDTAEELTAAVTNAINNDAGLQALGITATLIGVDILIANAPVVGLSSTDPGVELTLNAPAPAPVPALSVPAWIWLALALVIVAGLVLRRTSARAVPRNAPQ